MTRIKLQIVGGAANPAPPVGPALGQHGVNIQGFCKEFNDKTKEMKGEVVPVVISVYEDRSFSFIMKIAPVPELIKKRPALPRARPNLYRKRLVKSPKPRCARSLKRKCRT